MTPPLGGRPGARPQCALVIVALIPLALRGVGFRPAPASQLLQRNLLIYGVGGLIAPFVGIKAIDLIVSGLHLA